MKPVVRARGQALPLGVLLLAALALAWVHGYGLRQVAGARARLSHVADAVAYSGALSQARSLNLLAWISRTQLAHQMAMAHVATLAAWADFGSRQATQQGRGNPPAHLITSLFGARHGAAYRAASALAGQRQGAGWAQAYARHDSLIHDVLEQVRQATLADLVQTRQDAMAWVLARNLQGDFSGLAGRSAAAGSRLVLYDDTLADGIRLSAAGAGHGSYDWLAHQAAATPFLAPRNGTARNQYLVSPRCPHLRHELRRRGETALDAAGHWQALDTLSFKALRSNRWVGCYFRPYPMGWAWAAPADRRPGEAHVDGAPASFGDAAFWRWLQTHTDWPLTGSAGNPLATSYAVAEPLALRGRGLVADISIGVANPAFSIGLAVPAGALLTTGGASRVAMTGAWRFGALPVDGWLRADSAAAVEYVRPHARSRLPLEAANLYLPYWQARLTPVPVHTSRAGGQR